MDFHSLSRKELQALCKRHRIPANMTNIAMADALKALGNIDRPDERQETPPEDIGLSSRQNRSGASACKRIVQEQPIDDVCFVIPAENESKDSKSSEDAFKDQPEILPETSPTFTRTRRITAARASTKRRSGKEEHTERDQSLKTGESENKDDRLLKQQPCRSLTELLADEQEISLTLPENMEVNDGPEIPATPLGLPERKDSTFSCIGQRRANGPSALRKTEESECRDKEKQGTVTRSKRRNPVAVKTGSRTYNTRQSSRLKVPETTLSKASIYKNRKAIASKELFYSEEAVGEPDKHLQLQSSSSGCEIDENSVAISNQDAEQEGARSINLACADLDTEVSPAVTTAGFPHEVSRKIPLVEESFQMPETHKLLEEKCSEDLGEGRSLLSSVSKCCDEKLTDSESAFSDLGREVSATVTTTALPDEVSGKIPVAVESLLLPGDCNPVEGKFSEDLGKEPSFFNSISKCCDDKLTDSEATFPDLDTKVGAAGSTTSFPDEVSGKIPVADDESLQMPGDYNLFEDLGKEPSLLNAVSECGSEKQTELEATLSVGEVPRQVSAVEKDLPLPESCTDLGQSIGNLTEDACSLNAGSDSVVVEDNVAANVLPREFSGKTSVANDEKCDPDTIQKLEALNSSSGDMNLNSISSDFLVNVENSQQPGTCITDSEVHSADAEQEQVSKILADVDAEYRADAEQEQVSKFLADAEYGAVSGQLSHESNEIFASGDSSELAKNSQEPEICIADSEVQSSLTEQEHGSQTFISNYIMEGHAPDKVSGQLSENSGEIPGNFEDHVKDVDQEQLSPIFASEDGVGGQGANAQRSIIFASDYESEDANANDLLPDQISGEFSLITNSFSRLDMGSHESKSVKNDTFREASEPCNAKNEVNTESPNEDLGSPEPSPDAPTDSLEAASGESVRSDELHTTNDEFSESSAGDDTDQRPGPPNLCQAAASICSDILSGKLDIAPEFPLKIPGELDATGDESSSASDSSKLESISSQSLVPTNLALCTSSAVFSDEFRLSDSGDMNREKNNEDPIEVLRDSSTLESGPVLKPANAPAFPFSGEVAGNFEPVETKSKLLNNKENEEEGEVDLNQLSLRKLKKLLKEKLTAKNVEMKKRAPLQTLTGNYA